MRRWWEDKYHLPWTHETCQEQTLLDLLTQYWEDYYRKHPTDAKRVMDGKEVKFVTGDPLIDKWEDEIARGIEPDLSEGLPAEEVAKIRRARELSEQRAQVAEKADVEIGDGFAESYGA